MASATPVHLEPAPALDLAGLRLAAGAMLFGRLEHPREDTLGPRTRCLHVVVRLEGDDGGGHATTACPTHARDVHDPDDVTDERTRWWRGVVEPFHEPFHPRPSPTSVSPTFETRDFALALHDAEVGDRGVLTVAVSPESPRPCVLLRDSFEITRVFHEFAPRRLPSVLHACGAASSFATLENANASRATFGFETQVLLVLVALLAVFALAAARGVRATARPEGGGRSKLRNRVNEYVESVYAYGKRVWLAHALPPLSPDCPYGVAKGAWAVSGLTREKRAGRLASCMGKQCTLPIEPETLGARSNTEVRFPITEHDGFLFASDATWCVVAEVGVFDTRDTRDRAVQTKRHEKKRTEPEPEPETDRDLVAAFLASRPGARVYGFSPPLGNGNTEWDTETEGSFRLESSTRSPRSCESGHPFRTPAATLLCSTPPPTDDTRRDSSVDTACTEFRSETTRTETRKRAVTRFREGSQHEDDTRDGFLKTVSKPFRIRVWGRGTDATEIRAIADDMALSRFVRSVKARVLPGKPGRNTRDGRFWGPTVTQDPVVSSAKNADAAAKRHGRRTSAAFDFGSHASESPMDVAGFDGVAWRRGAGRVA